MRTQGLLSLPSLPSGAGSLALGGGQRGPPWGRRRQQRSSLSGCSPLNPHSQLAGLTTELICTQTAALTAGFSRGPGRWAWWVRSSGQDATGHGGAILAQRLPASLVQGLAGSRGLLSPGRVWAAGLSAGCWRGAPSCSWEAEQSSRLQHPQAIRGLGLVSSCPGPAGRQEASSCPQPRLRWRWPHHLAEREAGLLGYLLSAQGFGGKAVASGGQPPGQPPGLFSPQDATLPDTRPALPSMLQGDQGGTGVATCLGSATGGQAGLEPTAVCSQGRAPVSRQDCPLLLREVGSLLTPPSPVTPWGLLPGCREAPAPVPTEAETQPGCEHTGPSARGGRPRALWCAWSPGQQKGGRGTFLTPGRSVRLGAHGWAVTVTCIIGEGPESVDALPIDVAGSLSEARPGQVCSQWLTPRPPRDTGGGVGTGQGWSWGSEPPQDVKGNTPTPGRGANTNETEKLAPRVLFKL